MTSFILFMTLFIGQYDPIYVVSPACPVVRKEPYVYYRIPDREESRFYTEIDFLRRGTVRVPIINNWAPELTEGYLTDGSPYMVLDYRAKIPYESISTPERRKRKEFERYLEEWKAKEMAKEERLAPRPLVPVPQLTPRPVPVIVTEPKKASLPEPTPTITDDRRPLAPSSNPSSVLMPLRKPSDVGDADRVITPRYEER